MSEERDGSRIVPFVTRELPSAVRAQAATSTDRFDVLVADGSPDVRARSRCALEAGGHRVREAADLASAVEAAAAALPDCILLDQALAGDGHEPTLVGRLAAAGVEAWPAVVVTAPKGDVAAAVAALGAGALDYVETGRTSDEELGRIVHEAVLRNRSREERRRLDRRNEQLAAVVAFSSDAIIATGADGRVIRHWNPAAERLFGWSEAEAVGATIDDLLIPEGHERQREEMLAALAGGRAVFAETVRRHKSGALVEVEISATPIVGDQGRITGYSVIFHDIGERRRAREELESRERFSSAVLEASPDCLKVIDRDGRLTFMNANGCALMEIDDLASIRGRQWSDLWPEIERDKVAAAVKAARAGVATRFEAPCPTAKLTPKWWDVSVSPVMDARGEVSRIVSTSRDITESRQAQQALAESGRRLAAILDALPIGVALVDAEGTSLVANTIFRSYAPTTVPSRDDARHALWERRHPDGRRVTRDAYPAARALRGERVWPGEDFLWHGASEGPRWTRVAALPFRGADGGNVGAVVAIADIDREKRAQDSLQRSEGRLQLALAASEAGAWRWDIAGNLVEVSDSYRAVLGFTATETLTYDRWLERVHPEDRERSHARVAEVLAGGDTLELEFRIVHPELGVRWLLAHGRLERDGAGRPVDMTGINIDVTERRRTETDLARREALLDGVTERAGIGFYMLDRDWRFTYANGAYLETIGLPVRDVTGQHAADVVSPIRFGEVRHFHEQAMAGAVVTFERQGAVPGATMPHAEWRLITLQPHRDRSGAIVGLIGIVVDITERKRAEQALRDGAEKLLRREAELTRAQRLARIGSYEVIEDCGRFACRRSPEYLDIHGLPPEAWNEPHEAWVQRLHPDDRGWAEAAFRTAMAEGAREYRAEYRIVRPSDGETRWIKVLAEINADSDGRKRLFGTHGDVTERRQAEEALRASESFLRDVLDSLPEHVAVLDGRGIVEAVNEPWRRFAAENGGAPGAVAAGADYLDTCRRAAAGGDDYAQRALDGLAATLAGDRDAFEMEYPCHAPERERWFMLNARRLTGGRSGAIVSHLDITARRFAEQALRDSEERLRLILDGTVAFVGIMDVDGTLREANAPALTAGDLARDDVIGRRFWDCPWWSHDAGEAARLRQAVARAAGGEVVRYDAVVRMAGDTRMTIDFMLSPVRGADGTVRLLVPSGLDITDRKRAEEALRASEERFRTIVTTAQEGIWAIDREGRTTLANPSMAALLGTTVEALQRRQVADFCFPEDREEGRERITANLEGRAEEFEFRFRRADGGVVHVLAATAPLRGPGGGIVGALGGFLDLSERKKAEERQRILMREIAHRGKNLLAVVQSIALRTMTGERPLGEAREAFIGRLQALARTYSQLTDEVFEGAPLDAIVRGELATFGARVHIDGPRIMLAAKVSQTMALVVHELATNAAKHGALSTPEGRLDVTWGASGSGSDRRFRFDWREAGGPPVEAPRRRGFGTTLLTVVAGAELQSTPEVVHDPHGLRYRIDAPLGAIGTITDESPVRRRLESETLRALYDAWASHGEGAAGLPRFRRLHLQRFTATGGLTVAVVDGGRQVRFVEIGKALVERLGRAIPEDRPPADEEAALAEAYLRCAREARPFYEHLRFDFGGGQVVTLERLLLPFSRSGNEVTHVCGMIVFGGDNGAAAESGGGGASPGLAVPAKPE